MKSLVLPELATNFSDCCDLLSSASASIPSLPTNEFLFDCCCVSWPLPICCRRNRLIIIFYCCTWSKLYLRSDDFLTAALSFLKLIFSSLRLKMLPSSGLALWVGNTAVNYFKTSPTIYITLLVSRELTSCFDFGCIPSSVGWGVDCSSFRWSRPPWFFFIHSLLIDWPE